MHSIIYNIHEKGKEQVMVYGKRRKEKKKMSDCCLRKVKGEEQRNERFLQFVWKRQKGTQRKDELECQETVSGRGEWCMISAHRAKMCRNADCTFLICENDLDVTVL